MTLTMFKTRKVISKVIEHGKDRFKSCRNIRFSGCSMKVPNKYIIIFSAYSNEELLNILTNACNYLVNTYDKNKSYLIPKCNGLTNMFIMRIVTQIAVLIVCAYILNTSIHSDDYTNLNSNLFVKKM